MAKLRLAIAAAVLAAMSVLAAAQGPSYESRGYGGPLYVGPNFQHGGQHSPPVYNSKSSRKHHKRRRTYRAKSHKKRTVKQTETAKGSPEKSGVKSENSSISRTAKDAEEKAAAKTDDTAAVKNENSSISAAELNTGATSKKEDAPRAQKKVGCKKYFPTAGMTLSVPCN
jgi:hypothetical protein